MMTFQLQNRLSNETEAFIKAIIGVAIEVHRELGPGYLEKIYEKAMSLELGMRKYTHKTQVSVPIMYKGNTLHGQVLDMIVEDKVILEFKTVDKLLPAHEAQLLSYLKSTGISVGLLINFKVPLVKDGIKRFVRSPS